MYNEDQIDDTNKFDSVFNQDFVNDAIKSLKTINDMIRWVYSYFNNYELYYGHGFLNAWEEANELVLSSLNLSHSLEDKSLLKCRLTDSEKSNIIPLIKARVHSRIPLAYITNKSWFYGKLYYVDNRVIIPRSPIGELINNGFAGMLHDEPTHILDLCTGSGVLALAIADKFIHAQVDGVDISTDALDVAFINLEHSSQQIRDRVAFIQSDLFSNLSGNKYDLIITNPPYVDQEDFETMPEEYTHEPRISLESGKTGLVHTIRILKDSIDYLNPNSILICEVGNSMVLLQNLLPNCPFDWLTFENGGNGVFKLSYQQLIQHHNSFLELLDEIK